MFTVLSAVAACGGDDEGGGSGGSGGATGGSGGATGGSGGSTGGSGGASGGAGGSGGSTGGASGSGGSTGGAAGSGGATGGSGGSTGGSGGSTGGSGGSTGGSGGATGGSGGSTGGSGGATGGTGGGGSGIWLDLGISGSALEDLEVNATHLYVATPTQGVRKIAKSDKSATQVGPSEQCWDVSLTATAIIAGCQSSIVSIPLAGGNPTTLANEGARLVAVDATSVYYRQNGTNNIRKVALTGGSPVQLATLAGVSRIAVDSTSVYVAQGSDPMDLKKLPLAGGSTTTLHSATGGAGDLWPEGSTLFFGQALAGLKSVAIAGGAASTIFASASTGRFTADGSNFIFTTGATAASYQIAKGPKAGGTTTPLGTVPYARPVRADASNTWVLGGTTAGADNNAIYQLGK
ncbi:MAG: hypothetical protein IT377_20410 [Polyangiaceae bacterium]|nr:hypothetical protein [Polyangiaceae bacterium]